MNTTFTSRLITIWRRIGAGSLALSLAVHAGLFVLASLLLIHAVQEQPPVDFLPGQRGKAGEEADEALRQQVQAARRSSVVQKRPQVQRVTVQAPDAVVQLRETPLDLDDLPSADHSLLNAVTKSSGGGFTYSGLGKGWGEGTGIGGQQGMMPFVILAKGRCSLDERLKKLTENGGDAKCERAVSTALEWLRTKQNADGSWGRSHKGAMTGLALLCYLGRCYDADSVYGDTVTRAMLHLVELAQKNPGHIFSDKPEQHAASYEHGIATYALGEAWSFMRLGKTQMPGVREAFERGVRVIIGHQLPDGGWGYGDDFCYRRNGAGDLSVTGWQFQALKAAHFSGLKIEGLHKATDRAVDHLASKQTKDGGFGGTNREQGYSQWNLTGVGLLGLQTLGKGRTAEIRRGVKFAQDLLAQEPPHWDRNANLYSWYYLAQSLFQHGGEPWQQWNKAVLPQILANQNADGSWKPETADSSIASTAPAGVDRDIYRTTLCTLMLEVYFRYLKVGDRTDRSLFER